MRLFVLLLLGCGSSPPAEAPPGPPAGVEATRANADDVTVATVNGKPVWGSCVTAQAARGADRRAALQQCVDFELLAQTADGRGYALDAEVARATHTAMVSELVATAFEAGYTQPAQFGPFWQQAYKKGIFHIRHENYRASAYVRVAVANPADEGAAQHAIADKVAAAVANESGLMGPSLVALAQQAAGPEVKLDHQDVPAYRAGALDEHYAAALFAIPQIGRASGAVRTKWGWDVIAWTDDVPAADPPEADVIAKLLPDVKLAYFNHWVEGIAKSLGVSVTLVQDNIAKLEDL
jgi:hypothetical protein